MSDDAPIGLRGPGRPSPRWAPVAAVFDGLADAHARGGIEASEPFARQVYEATLVDDVDGEGLDMRARALSNLAASADARGDLDRAFAYAAECLEVCDDVDRLIGDARSTSAVRVAALVNRAQMLQVHGRAAEAVADLDAAMAAAPPEDAGNPHAPANRTLLTFALHNTRGNALAALERWDEADTAFRVALDIALADEPRLAAQAYSGLALVAHRTGDRTGAREQFRLARELYGDDAAAAATAEQNLARLAIEVGDLEEAARRFEAAERGYIAAGESRLAAGCVFGRAVVLFQRTRLVPARTLAVRALDVFREHGDVWAQVEAALLLGDLHFAALQFVKGEDYYLAARALCTQSGAAHELARVDVRRALVASASSRVGLRKSKREQRRQAALNLALPAAIATDAMRYRFPPGPVRERWIREVASVARTAAFDAMKDLRYTQGVIEFMELLSASVTLEDTSARPRAVADNDDDAAFPASPFQDVVALAAGGSSSPTDPSGAEPTARGATLPPRVRALPGEGAALEEWIVEAENRYGVAARSAEVVDAW